MVLAMKNITLSANALIWSSEIMKRISFGIIGCGLMGREFASMEHGRRPALLARCVTPEETALSHRLFSAALESQRTSGTIVV